MLPGVSGHVDKKASRPHSGGGGEGAGSEGVCLVCKVPPPAQPHMMRGWFGWLGWAGLAFRRSALTLAAADLRALAGVTIDYLILRDSLDQGNVNMRDRNTK
jgi:hypothetical protein